MKLLFCTSCGDVRKLRFVTLSCQCGSSRGRYLKDGDHAEISGVSARVLLIGNGSLVLAARGEKHAIPEVTAEGAIGIWACLAGPNHPKINRRTERS